MIATLTVHVASPEPVQAPVLPDDFAIFASRHEFVVRLHVPVVIFDEKAASFNCVKCPKFAASCKVTDLLTC